MPKNDENETAPLLPPDASSCNIVVLTASSDVYPCLPVELAVRVARFADAQTVIGLAKLGSSYLEALGGLDDSDKTGREEHCYYPDLRTYIKVDRAINDLLKRYPEWTERDIHVCCDNKWLAYVISGILGDGFITTIPKLNLCESGEARQNSIQIAGRDYLALKRSLGSFASLPPLSIRDFNSKTDFFIGMLLLGSLLVALTFLFLLLYLESSLEFCSTDYCVLGWSNPCASDTHSCGNEPIGWGWAKFPSLCKEEKTLCPSGRFVGKKWRIASSDS